MPSTASHRQSVYIKNDMAQDDVPEDVNEAQARALFSEDNEQPVRHLFIDWPASSIKGTFTIGASVPDAVPPLFDMPLAEVTQQNAASAVFKTRSSPINVVVNVVHGQGGQHTPFAAHTPQPATPPAAKTDSLNPSTLIDSMRKNSVFISAKSVSNSVTVNVPEYFGRRPMHIRLTVMLPPSFNGMISWRSETGTIQTSADVTSHVKRLDSDQNKRHGTMKFVADPDLPAWMTGNGRRGDVCELITKTGRISVYMSGEKKRATSGCVVS